jgi:hypothetical protein
MAVTHPPNFFFGFIKGMTTTHHLVLVIFTRKNGDPSLNSGSIEQMNTGQSFRQVWIKQEFRDGSRELKNRGLLERHHALNPQPWPGTHIVRGDRCFDRIRPSTTVAPRNEANEAWIWMYCGRWLGKVDLTAQVHYQKFKTERWSSSSTILFNFRGLAFLFISFRMCCTCVWSTKMALIKQT